MTNNSAVYWTANGLSLHTLAWSVKSFGGKRFFGPGKRGEDLLVPFRDGRRTTRKMREPLVYDLNMWVLPVTTEGTRDPSLTREQKAHENFRTIVTAIDVNSQFALTKRWYEGGAVKTATALAEFMDGDGPSADDGTGFDFRIQLMLADPHFYGPKITQALSSTPIVGEVDTSHATVVLSGGTNPRVTVADGNWIQYQGSPGSNPVTLDFSAGQAKQSGNYVNGLIVRNPEFPEWPSFEPGTTPILSGGGTADIEYEAAYR